MSRCYALLLVAAVIAGGCSRDAPLVAPGLGAASDVARSVALTQPAVEPSADAVDDALGRLLPALEGHGSALKSALLKLKADRGSQAARDEANRVIDQLAATLTASHHADLDALRLELGMTTK